MKDFVMYFAFFALFEAGANAQQQFDPSNQVFLGGELMSYEAALPLATEMLSGNTQEQVKATTALIEFGVSLKGTKALEKLLQIVKRPDDFSVLDQKLEIRAEKDKDFLSSPEGKALADLLEIKCNALTAVVMAGSPEGEEALRTYFMSKSLVYRHLAEDAGQLRDNYGTWTRGKRPTKEQSKTVFYDGQVLPMDAYIRAIERALDSRKARDLNLAITSLSVPSSAPLIKGTAIYDRLFSIFVQPRESNLSERDLKLSIIRIIQQSGDPRTHDFLKAAADDKDDVVRRDAVGLLE